MSHFPKLVSGDSAQGDEAALVIDGAMEAGDAKLLGHMRIDNRANVYITRPKNTPLSHVRRPHLHHLLVGYLYITCQNATSILPGSIGSVHAP